MNYSIEDKLRVASSNVELETFKATSKLEKDLQNFGSEHHKSLIYSYIAEYIRIRANALDDIVKDIPSEEVFKDNIDTIAETFYDTLIKHKEALKLAKVNDDLGYHKVFSVSTTAGEKPFLDSVSNEFLFKFQDDLSLDKAIEISETLTEDKLTELRQAITEKFNESYKTSIIEIDLDEKIPDDATGDQLLLMMKNIFLLEPGAEVKTIYGNYLGTVGYFTEVFNVIIENICKMYLDDVDDDEKELSKYPYKAITNYINALFDNLLIVILHSVNFTMFGIRTFESHLNGDMMATLQPIIDKYGILNKNR